MIDLQPSEEQQLIVETLRNFASKEIRPCARECDESGALPDPVLHAAHELGLVANALDEQQDNAEGRSAVTAPACLTASKAPLSNRLAGAS